MTPERNIAKEAREQVERAQMVRRWRPPSNPPNVGPAFPRSRSVAAESQWPLDEAMTESDGAVSSEFERASSRVLVEQALRAPGLDDTDRRIIQAIVAGDSRMTVVELAAEADISRASLYRRLEVLEVVLADALGREAHRGGERDTRKDGYERP